nr:hypothetical protein [Tanacetum cinerariifolium]
MTTSATTTALSTILVSVSIIILIPIDDYEIVDTDDQSVAGGNAAPFPNVEDADLHIPYIVMPISVGMTASVPYVNVNGVSPLLDFIMAAICSFHQTIGLRVLNRSKVSANT